MSNQFLINLFQWPGEGYVAEIQIDGIPGCYTRAGLQWIVINKLSTGQDAAKEQRILSAMNCTIDRNTQEQE